MKKVLFLFIFLFCFGIPNVLALEFDITSDHVIMYNLKDKEILYELNRDEKVNIASLTKIMSIIVAIENVDDLNEKVVVSREAFQGISEYTQMGLKVGDQVTVMDLLYGAMLPSGADAVNALAIHVSGDISSFVQLMNEKAHDLKLKNTHFDNPIGMDSEENYSTSFDVAQILMYGLKNEVFRTIFEARDYTVSSLGIRMKSTLIGYSSAYGLDISYITGAKSGFTDGAGLCLASTAVIDDVPYLLVTMGADTKSRSNAVRDSLEIYDYFSNYYSYQNVIEKDDVFQTIPIRFGRDKNYKLKAKDTVSLYLENGIRKNKMEYVYDGIDEIRFGMHKGDKLGVVTVKYKDQVLTTYDVYLDQELEFYHPLLYLVLAVALILFLTSIFLMIQKKKRGKKKRKRKKRKNT